jgi:hypothetical protein
VAVVADKTQRNKNSKGKKRGEFKKSKRLSQQLRKGYAHLPVTIAEQIAQSKDKNKDKDKDL